MPTYVLFLQFKDNLLYDPEEDVKVVLNAVAALGQCGAADLQKQTGLSVGRLNRAVDYLEDYGKAKVLRFMGTAPYSFGTVLATSQTRQAVRR